MGTILDQFGLDYTFFVQFGIFTALFLILSQLYFKPFMALFQARHKRTIEDRETAEKLTAQAEAKFREFKERMAHERAQARQEYENLLGEAKAEEEAMLSRSWAEARRITKEANQSAAEQREKIRAELKTDVDSLAELISEKILKRQG